MLNAVYATPIPSFTRAYCIKTAERIIDFFALSVNSVRPIILVIRHQELLRKSDGFTPGRRIQGDRRIDWRYLQLDQIQ